MGTRTWSAPARAAGGRRPDCARGAGGNAAWPRGDGGTRDVGHPEPNVEAPAVDLDVDVALDAARRAGGLGIGIGLAGAATPERSSVSSTHLVECVAAAKSGCSRMARWAGIVVATPSISVSREGAEHAPAGVLAVLAPDDELGDEVVVVLADGVAVVVAGVDAGAEAVGPAEAGDRAGRGQEPARRRGSRR